MTYDKIVKDTDNRTQPNSTQYFCHPISRALNLPNFTNLQFIVFRRNAIVTAKILGTVYLTQIPEDTHLFAKTVELNPVKAKTCALPGTWQWSSAGAHISDCDDPVVTVVAMMKRVSDWRSYLSKEDAGKSELINQFSTTERPASTNEFVTMLEELSGRELYKNRPGPKPGIK